MSDEPQPDPDAGYLHVRCDACNAEPYEPCRPYCVARPDDASE
jgi:hypothetical protein